MTKERKAQLIEARQAWKDALTQEIKEASTPHELIQAWVRYTGRLEAQLDIYDIEAE